MQYVERGITEILISRMQGEQMIVITGPRQAGKTTLCEYLVPERLHLPFTYVSFDDPDERLRFQRAGIAVLESIETPLVILDEVQKIPSLFDPLKFVVDKRKGSTASPKVTYLLTGSSQLLLIKNIRETLAGRVALMNLFPFSLAEVMRGERPAMLTAIWEGWGVTKTTVSRFNALSPSTVREMIRLADEHKAWGGYPPVWQREGNAAKLNWLKDYRRTYVERDISDVGQVASIDTFVLAQKLLCARTGQILSMSEVARDLALSVNTVKRYVHLLAATFQCHLLQPYFENIGKRLIKSPKIYFPDMGLNRVILGERPVDIGPLYESWVFSELLKWKQLQAIEPEVFFYRTGGGLEIDFLFSGNGILLPIEAKSSEKASPADGRHLETFVLEHGKRAPLGILVYPGRELVQVRKNVWAVPDWFLFGASSAGSGTAAPR
jgi:uncharacterized protein